MKLQAFLRHQGRLRSLRPRQSRGGLLPVLRLSVSLPTVPIAESDADFSLDVTNCVTRQRTRTQGAAKPWNREGRFCALWRGNLPAPSTATCVVFQVFKGKIFSVGKRLQSYRKCSRCSAFLEWKFPRLKRNLCGNSAGKLCHVD